MVNPGFLPDRGNLMLLMAILPMMLIATIVVVTELDARGLLGPPRRKVSLHVPLSAIAGGLAFGAAALGLAKLTGPSAHPASQLLLASVCFHVGWGLLHLRLRSALTATVGLLGAGVILAVSLLGQTLAVPDVAREFRLVDLFGVAFETALTLALVPQVAPSLAARLTAREMKVQRATVLSGFCVAVTVLFASLALLG